MPLLWHQFCPGKTECHLAVWGCAMPCNSCLNVFETIGNALNSPLETVEILGSIARSIVDNLHVKGCQFFMFSRDQKQLESLAAFDAGEKVATTSALEVEGVLSEVLHGDTILIKDCAFDPRVQSLPGYQQAGVKSLLLLPLKSRGQVIGSMHITADEEWGFSGDELAVIRTVAALCTSIIVRSMFQQILHDVSEYVPQSLEVKAVLDQIAKSITENLRAKGCVIRLLDADSGRLELWASYGLSQAFFNKGPVEASRAKAETIEGKCVAVYDALQYMQYPDAARQEGIASLLSVPLLLRGASIGYLRVFTSRPYEFSSEEMYLMKMVGEQCAVLINGARLYSQVKDKYEKLMVDFHNWFDWSYGAGVTESKKIA